MKHLPIVFAIILFCTCSSHKSVYPKWVQLEQWDLNKDYKLDTTEFHSGYLASCLYKAWTNTQESMNCPAVLSQLFHKIDSNHSGTLDSTEVNRRSLRYFLGSTDSKLLSLELSRNSHVDSIVFKTFAAENLCHIFDPDSNGVITANELAKSMFLIGDQDSNGFMGGMEFYQWELYQPHVTWP